MQLPFCKMHGTGNHILVVDARADGAADPAVNRLRELADAASGPGFDQLLWVGKPLGGSSLASYRVFNADGSEVEQCGNGLRCVAAWLAGDTAAEFTLDSPAGPVMARVPGGGEVSVSMGAPVFAPAAIPFHAPLEADSYTLEVGGRALEIGAVSMGNPHAVLSVDDVATAAVAELGPAIECHPRFPARCNVGFAETIGPGHLRLRVFERGVGETAACGTGACAAAVVGMRRGRLARDVRVSLPGGELVISWRGPGEPVWLTGGTEKISEGRIDL